MSDGRAAAPTTRPGRAATTVGRLAVLLAAPALAGALLLVALTAVALRDPAADPLTAIGYVIAGILGAPALLGLALAGGGLALRRRMPRTALGLATAGLAALVVLAGAVALWTAAAFLG